VNPGGILKGKGSDAIRPLFDFLLKLIWILVKGSKRYNIVILSGAKIMPLVVIPVCIVLRKKSIVRVESYFELYEPISSESLRAMGSRRGWVLFRLLRAARKLALKHADAVIAISAQIHEMLLKHGVRADRIVSIPNGINLKVCRPLGTAEKAALRAQLGLPADRTLVLYSGRLSRAKGVRMLVDAWPKVVVKHPQLHLVVVGSGGGSFDDCETEVKELVRERGLTSQVTFVDETPAVVSYLQAADLWVFPTEYEGFSLALAEAMGCALPVLATTVGAAPQLIQHGENGFLFPPLDEKALIDVMDEAMREREKWPLIGAAARAAVAPYDLDIIADQYAGLCQQLLDSSSVTRAMRGAEL
jgi:glycosyltransferase involved in cell wall biosynthesis